MNEIRFVVIVLTLAVTAAVTTDEVWAESAWAELGRASESEELEALRNQLQSVSKLLAEAKAEMEEMRSLGNAGGATQPGAEQTGEKPSTSTPKKIPSRAPASGRATKSGTKKNDEKSNKPDSLLDQVESRLDAALERLGRIEAIVGGRKALD